MVPTRLCASLGTVARCGRGGQAAGLSGAFGSCAAGVLTPVTPETPLPSPEKPGAVESPYCLPPPFPPLVFGVTVLGRNALLGWRPWHLQPFYGGQWGRVAKVTTARSRGWPKAPIPGGGPESGPGAC